MMTETITSTVATTYLYNSANQLVTARRSDEGVTWFYTHDRRGNLVRQTPGGTDPADGETRYTYDSANWCGWSCCHGPHCLNADWPN